MKESTSVRLNEITKTVKDLKTEFNKNAIYSEDNTNCSTGEIENSSTQFEHCKGKVYK